MLDIYRKKFKPLEEKTGAFFSKLPLVPNHYTILSIVFVLACAVSVISAHFTMAFFFFLSAGILDFVDGAVARKKNIASPFGAYLDTIADRYVEAIVLLSFLFLSLPQFFLPGFVWIFLALFGSTMTTYAKAAAFEKQLSKTELKGGLMSRAERLVFYLAALAFLGYNFLWTTVAVAALAILSNITALQRIYAAKKQA